MRFLLKFPRPDSQHHLRCSLGFQTVFILALIWRHRIRYMFEKFLWTGKVDEGVAKTLRSNALSLNPGGKV